MSDQEKRDLSENLKTNLNTLLQIISQLCGEVDPDEYVQSKINEISIKRRPYKRRQKRTKTFDIRRKNNIYTNRQLQDVVSLFKENYAKFGKPNAKDIAIKTGVKIGMVYSVISQCKKDKPLRKTRFHKQDPLNIRQDVAQYFINFAEDPRNKNISVKRGALACNQMLGTTYDYKAYLNLMKCHGFKRKRVRYESSNKFKDGKCDIKLEFLQRLLQCLEGEVDLISVDETSVSEDCLAHYGWDLSGTGNTSIPKKPNPKVLSLISAISLKHGVISYQVIEGAYDASFYYEFLFQTYQIYRLYDLNTKINFLVDNNGSHLNKKVFIEYYSLINSNINDSGARKYPC